MKALKFSRQRESIRECLKNRKDHPTADAVYVTISKDYPKISLGTVYPVSYTHLTLPTIA